MTQSYYGLLGDSDFRFFPEVHMSTRLPQLQQLLEKSPNDTFLLYAIAMEHKKSGDTRSSLAYFDKVIHQDPGYCYAYHQKGLLLESAGDAEGAKAAYHQGIAAADKKGDHHAKEEIAAALSMLE
jgi:tetratricopeptide (TPR) repeat protein